MVAPMPRECPPRKTDLRTLSGWLEPARWCSASSLSSLIWLQKMHAPRPCDGQVRPSPSRECCSAGNNQRPPLAKQLKQVAAALLNLVPLALPWRFVRTPAQKFCSVPESVTRKMIIAHFDHELWSQWFPCG